MAEIGNLPTLARALIEEGDVDAVQEKLLEALRKEPENCVLWAETGYFLHTLGNFDDSISALERAIHLGMMDVKTLFYLGVSRYSSGDLAGAAQDLANLVNRDSRYGDSWHYLGLSLAGQGQFAEAEAALDMARTRLDTPSAILDRLWRLKCLAGNWVLGWRLFEQALPNDLDDRWQAAHHTLHRLWRGQPLASEEIVVFSHGGYGDVINFFRFVADLSALRPSEITLLIPPSLHALIKESPVFAAANEASINILAEDGKPRQGSGYFTWFEGLALHFKANLGNLHRPYPYLMATEERRSAWAALLQPSRGLRVGLIWRGSPAMPEDHWRSIPLEAFASLFRLDRVQWFGLQGAPITAQEHELLDVHGVQDLSQGLTDFAETAAAMSCLDLIISVDSAPVHLAGALGLPVWLLNRATSEWRWGWHQKTSFWYPAMHIYNQRNLGQWDETLAQVKEALLAKTATL